MKQEEVKDKLHEEVLKVVFRKADGTDRTMYCTLTPDILPIVEETEEPKKERKQNPEVQPVFEITRDGNKWRSFKWDSLISVNGVPYVSDN